jgi:hypothetical protein
MPGSLQPNLKQTAGIKPAADTAGGLVAVFGGFIKTAGGSAAFFFNKKPLYLKKNTLD